MQVKLNPFTEFSLDEKEELLGSVYSDVQIAVIQNLIAKFAIERANLQLDYNFPEAEKAYMLAQQKNLGAIEALTFLIALSDDAKPRLEALIRNSGTHKEG